MPTEGLALETLAPQHTLVVHGKVPLDRLPATLGEMYAAVYAYAARIGVQPVGHPFARYFAVEPLVDLEAGIVVAEPAEGQEQVEAGTLPGGEACVAWHIGPYETAVETYHAMQKFMEARGRKPSPVMWEFYVSDPVRQTDPATWRTQCVWPVAR